MESAGKTAFLAPPASPDVEPHLDQLLDIKVLARIAETMSYIQTCACARPPFRRFLAVQTQPIWVGIPTARGSCFMQRIEWNSHWIEVSDCMSHDIQMIQ